jgi:hypothetical protein
MPWVRIAVETRTNCDLYMQVEYLDSVNDGHVSFIVQPASTWHSSPYTVTIPGTAETLTIEVCEETDVIFPEANDPVALRAALWFLVDGVWSPYIAGDPETPPPNKVYAAGSGNSMCVLTGCNDTNPDHIIGYLQWEYDIRTDEVIVKAGSTVAYGEIRLPWDSAGAWADTLTVIPVDAPFIPAWATDAEWRVAKITNCDDPTDPGDECEPYNCYPLCVANTCPDNPDIVNASILFWNLDCSGGTGDHDGQFEYNPIGGGSSEDTYTAGDWPFTGVPTIYCDGTDIALDDLDLFGVTWGPIVMTLECVEGEASWSYVFTDPAGGGSGGGPAETCTLTIFTNNGGGL